MRHKWKYFGIFAASVLLTLSDAYAQMAWVKNGKPVSRILVANPDSANHQAALLLQDFIERISGASLPILESAQGKKGDILIGKGDTSGLTEDGFRLKTENQTLEISSGGDKGAIYGVVTLLEDYLGVECYTSHVYNIQKRKDIVIPEINRFENPSFRYRQTQSYASKKTRSTRCGSDWKSRKRCLPATCGCTHSTKSSRLPNSGKAIRNTIPISMGNAARAQPANGA